MVAASGVISRQVLPACGTLCFFCPSLRARSRQPVKRYKKLIADIFPRNHQEEGTNDRKIGKLCDYAARNPLRIPKITNAIGKRCYKELRNENFHSTKIVMCIYRKLMFSCKEQMPLFASSLLTIIHALLDQTWQDEMRILGCHCLFDFVNNQVRYMGEHSHISVEFDNIVSVVLENYRGPNRNLESLYHEEEKGPENVWVKVVMKNEGHISPVIDVEKRIPLWSNILNDKGELNVTMGDAKNPSFWSRVCLHNMANLAREGTTIRRVMESLFRYFDNGSLWSAGLGLAFSVLKDMLFLMDDSGLNTHVLLSILIKHLDHKVVLKQPNIQLDIVEVVISLAQYAKVQPSVAIIGTVHDLMRHLPKSIHYSLDDSNLDIEIINWNKNFREAVDRCLVQLSNKVGEAGPILDIMAVMLENISTITVISRTTVSAVYRTAQIVASLPN
ncbi:EFR3-like B [Spatholobus suberectus]|nr:EFR3-like B [Spatholobus suberectus]